MNDLLSPAIKERLERAYALQNNYQPNQQVADSLAEKTLIMVVGPAATGKSHIMNTAGMLHQDFARVHDFTTRAPRPDDQPGIYEYYPHTDEGLDKLLAEIEQRYVVQYIVHPTTHAIYGTRMDSYTANYNMLETISGVVDHLRSMPFQRTVTIGLVAQPQVWQQWFLERYRDHDEERSKRATEAILSLGWLLDQPEGNVLWLENKKSQSEQTAQELIQLSLYGGQPNQIVRQYAEECLTLARSFVA